MIGLAQDIPQPGERHTLFRSLAEQFGEKGWAFKPPMAEELCIKGCDQERLRVHDVVQLRELQAATLQIVTRMAPHLLSRPLRLVGLFGLERGTVIGDGVQFESEGPGLVQPERFQLLQRQIPAEVAVKFPVGRMAGIPVAC